MSDRCYNCYIDLNKDNRTTEHIPTQNLYTGFALSYMPDEFAENPDRETRRIYIDSED